MPGDFDYDDWQHRWEAEQRERNLGDRERKLHEQEMEQEIQRRIEEERRKAAAEKQHAIEEERRRMQRMVLESGLQKFYKQARPIMVKIFQKFVNSPRIAALEKAIVQLVKRIYGVDIEVDLKSDLQESQAFWLQLTFYCLFPDMKLMELSETFFEHETVHGSVEKMALFGFLTKWLQGRKAKKKNRQAYEAIKKQIWPVLVKASNDYLGLLSAHSKQFQALADKVYGHTTQPLVVRYDFKGSQAKSVRLALFTSVDEYIPDNPELFKEGAVEKDAINWNALGKGILKGLSNVERVHIKQKINSALAEQHMIVLNITSAPKGTNGDYAIILKRV